MADKENKLGQEQVPASIDHMQNDICVPGFFQGAAKCFDQLMGQFMNEAYGVCQKHLHSIRKVQRPGGRIKGCKQFILCQNLGPGQCIQQRGFPAFV